MAVDYAWEGNPNPNPQFNKSKPKKQDYIEKMKTASPCIIDCHFQTVLTEKELKSLCVQLGYCHAVNQRMEKPMQLSITSYFGFVKEQTQACGADGWGLKLHEESMEKVFPKEKLVYLTADSPDVLDQFNEKFPLNSLNLSDIYIVGGLVDHNRFPKGTYNRAQELGIRSAKLPLSTTSS